MMKVDIEESVKYVDQGILVLTNGKRKFYARAKATGDKQYPYELVPLTSDEMKKFGIEESFQGDQSNDWHVDVEESEGQEETGKTHKVNLNDPKDIEAAKEVLAVAEKRLHGDSEKQELEEENEDLKGKLAMLAEINFQKKRKELGCTDPEIDTVDKLMSWQKGREGNPTAPAGSAPLNDRQMGIQLSDDIMKKKFNSPQEMISYLRRLEKSDNPVQANQAKNILNAMFEKWAREKKQGTNEQPFDANSVENLPPMKKVGDFLTPIDPTQGDLAQFKKTRAQKEQEKKELE
jgi:uncharacterized membrane protein YkoI